MSHLYTTKVTAVGGRSGTIKSDDGILDLRLAVPKELGGKGGATNPEQLFAAGYAACFENAVIHVTRAQADKVRDNDIQVVGEVGLLPNGAGGFNLAVPNDSVSESSDRSDSARESASSISDCSSFRKDRCSGTAVMI